MLAERSASYDEAVAAPTLYFDLGSPYAYLAVARAPAVLGVTPQLEPILVGALFQRRGWGSWAQGPARAQGIAEVESRAARYGLPPLVWPADWPANGLAAMRAAIWAKRAGRAESFVAGVFRRQFVEGDSLTSEPMLADCAAQAGLDPVEMATALRDGTVKHELRSATDRAWDLGVRGVPTLEVNGAIFYGDDHLEAAAAHLAQ